MDALEFRFAFYARDLDASVRFYQETLGMAYIEGWDRPDGKGALLSAGGTAVIEIHGAAEGNTYAGPAPAAIYIALRLDQKADVDSWYARLVAAGTHVPEAPQDHFWGHRSFVVYDPDGIPVHLYCEIVH